MGNFPILKELTLILAVALLISFIFHRFRIPTLVGFMITGIVIGPGGLRLITDMSAVEVLAEIGIVLLTCIPQIGMNIFVEKTLFIVYNIGNN